MIRLGFVVLLAGFVCLVSGLSPALGDGEPQFRLGFRRRADLIPEVVGSPLEEEHHNAFNGDGLQQTTTGLMVWRKADNWTAFTDGWRTWVNGPLGLQERFNHERFDWEAPDLPAGNPAEAPSLEPVGLEAGPTLLSPDFGLEPPVPTFAATSSLPVLPSLSTPPSPTLSATSTPEPSSTPAPTSTPRPAATATRAPTVPPTVTPVPGSVLSPSLAGAWVTSNSPSTTYYTSAENSSRWDDWVPEHRIWFQTEAALLAAYPNRVRWQPTSTPPARTATATPVPAAIQAPTATRGATPTRTPVGVSGGIISPTPAGDWVTSTSAATKYYTTRDDSYWQNWVEGNRIWFATEADLLATYPTRVRR